MERATSANIWSKTGTPDIISCLDAALKTPVMTDPGTRWEYGINIDFVGKAVEAASGKKLDVYLRENMFTPLGMNDTGFKITDRRMRQRLVGMHARGEDGTLAPIPFELEQAPEFHMGGGGLYGTAADYIKFTQMMLNKGRGNGNQRAEAGDGRADGAEPHRRSHHGQDDDGAAALHQRCRSLSRYRQEVGPELPDQHRQDRQKAAAPAASPGPASPTPISGSIRCATSAA